MSCVCKCVGVCVCVCAAFSDSYYLADRIQYNIQVRFKTFSEGEKIYFVVLRCNRMVEKCFFISGELRATLYCNTVRHGLEKCVSLL